MGDHDSRAPGFALIKIGEFSHINEQVLAQQKLPELRAQALDDLKNARSEGGRETIASS